MQNVSSLFKFRFWRIFSSRARFFCNEIDESLRQGSNITIVLCRESSKVP